MWRIDEATSQQPAPTCQLCGWPVWRQILQTWVNLQTTIASTDSLTAIFEKNQSENCPETILSSWPVKTVRHNTCFCILFFLFLHFIKTLFFKAVLGVQQNWEKGTEIFYLPPALTQAYSPVINIPHHNGIFVMTGEPTLTHCCHSKASVCIRVPY